MESLVIRKMPEEPYRRTDARFLCDDHLARPLRQRTTSIVTREEMGLLFVFVTPKTR
jgi:hypothetical protein